jgi:AsmA protein
MVANGDLLLDLSKIPRVSATLSTDLLAESYLLHLRPARQAGIRSNGWNTFALDFGGLKGVDGNLTLSAFQVKWNGAEIGPVEMSGALKDGRLETSMQNASLYGGKATAKIILDGAGDSSVLQLTLDAQNIKGESFLSEFADLDWLAGNTGLKASLSATGNSQREMMSTLAGNFTVEISDGEITGLNIVDMVSKVSSALSDGWGEGPENLTSFDTALASFLIEDGIARTTDVTVEGPAFQVSGSGEVDMLRRALDFKFDPKLVTGGNGNDQASGSSRCQRALERAQNIPRCGRDSRRPGVRL